MKEYVEFKKQRELGAILTDVFKFIRLEWRDLGSLLLRIAGPVLLLVVVCYIYYMQSTFGGFQSFLSTSTPFEVFSISTVISLLLFVFSVLAFYSLLYATVLCYIKSYVAHQGKVDRQEVSDGVKRFFWSMLGLNILVGLIVGFGIVLCFLPGVYLGVCLALSAPILVFERKDVIASIGDSFKLIKDEWWITFATFIVIYILYYVIMLIFQIPQLFYIFFKGFTMSEEISANPFEIIDWFSITLEVIAMIAQYTMFTLLIISIAMVYYNLNERKNFTGTLETIDQLGESK
tara:strand:+ start:17693 stop:18562 length:870 start_codon:yes stop_codon:yes gene_type:complete